MGTLLVKNASHVISMDDADQRWIDAGIYVVDNVIRQIGPTSSLPASADQVVDAKNMILIPGLVNTHHHFYQTLTRCLPDCQNMDLFHWLSVLYPIWAGLTPEAIYVSSKVAIAELMLSGCTTSSDHTYLWPNGSKVDDQIQAATELGFRFHATRGSMSLGRASGALPPDSVVEDETSIMRDCRRLIEQFHDASRYAMVRIALAPCSLFSVTLDLMRETAEYARSAGVHLHSHLVETIDEERFCLEKYGRRPVELAEDLGWVGSDVWFAHVVHPSAAEVTRLGGTRTGVAHCPTSNMRLAAGISPMPALRAAGARVGLGVDGSSSNDSGHLLAEARQAMLQRRMVTGNAAALTAKDALRLATRGGAQTLGRDDIGYLAPGMAADFVGFRLDTLDFAGAAVHDPVAALVFCHPPKAHLSVINGKIRVEDGILRGIDVPQLVESQNRIARALVRGER